MVKNIESNNNIVCVAIVAIVAIVGLLTLFINSNNQNSSHTIFEGGNVAGHAFGGSQWCMWGFQLCVQEGNSMDYCMDDYEHCEVVHEWLENYHNEIQSR